MTTAVRHEVEVDRRLAEAHRVLARARQALNWATDEMRRSVGQSKNYRTGVWTGILADAIAAADGHTPSRASTEYHEAKVAYLDALVAVDRLNALYTGWSRFFLVTNTNGHIHSSMSCSTCFETTEFAWLPDLSGLSEADAVADQGEILCSVCFPSAPSEWTTGVAKATLLAREAAAARKAAAAARKAEKALGTTVRIGTWERIETIAAAKTWLTDSVEWPKSHRVEDVKLVAEALAARLGTTVETELQAAARRAAKRR